VRTQPQRCDATAVEHSRTTERCQPEGCELLQSKASGQGHLHEHSIFRLKGLFEKCVVNDGGTHQTDLFPQLSTFLFVELFHSVPVVFFLIQIKIISFAL
jgi:hypothetical protein